MRYAVGFLSGAPGANRTHDPQLRSLKPFYIVPLLTLPLDHADTYAHNCALRWFPPEFLDFVLHRFYMAQSDVS
jgi:hypothetical protein